MEMGLRIEADTVLYLVRAIIDVDPVQYRRLFCDCRYKALEFFVWIWKIVASEWMSEWFWMI